MAEQTARASLSKQIQLLLGDQMVEVELDPEHLNLAITMAIEKTRQRTDGSMEERMMFITLQPYQTEYTLPEEIQEVRKLYRRGVGTNANTGINFDPFEAAFSNLYLLQSGNLGGIATWDFFSQYQETLSRVFSSELNFIWDTNSKKLTIVRRVVGEETVLVHVWAKRPEDVILGDPYLGPWCRSYATAVAKMMLGQARSKFKGGLPGPQGSVTLNGEDLKSESTIEMKDLEKELEMFVASSNGMPFIIG